MRPSIRSTGRSIHGWPCRCCSPAADYALGVTSLWRRAGFGRGVRCWQAALYGGGWAALAGALLSPLHAMGERLFSAHMVEHEIVMAVAVPLMVLARPAPGCSGRGRAPRDMRLVVSRVRRSLRTAWRFVTAPVAATALHGIAIWALARAGRCSTPRSRTLPCTGSSI